MPKPDSATARALALQFRLEGRLLDVRPYGTGHINDTFLLTTDAPCTYVLQRLSPVAFHRPEQVMDNLTRVTDHLRRSILARGGNPLRETLTPVPTAGGEPYRLDGDGCCWRVFLNVEDTVSYQLPESEDIFREAGRAFGAFQTALMDYPPETLHETIPHFHDTPRRVQALRQAAAADRVGRAAQVQPELDFALARSSRSGALVDGLAAGRLPLRVTHNDTKLNNVLLDKATGRGLCVIDLDTVMPGLSAYDFGDAIRFGASTAEEDEADLSRVHFSLPMYRAWCDGYLGEAGAAMTDAELDSLPVGAWMMTYEVGVRFLTDYLDGDRYFHTAYAEHNLVRARNQFALLADMEAHEQAMADALKPWKKE